MELSLSDRRITNEATWTMHGKPNPDLERFESVDAERRSAALRQRKAFKRVGAATAGSTESVAAWSEYCESVRTLAERVAELEELIWRMKV